MIEIALFLLLGMIITIAILKGQLLRGGLTGVVADPTRRPTFAGRGMATGGKPRKGMAFRAYEGDIAAVDTLTNLTAFAGSTVTVIVPQGAVELDMVDIGVSLDLGAAVVSVRGHAQVRIIGQGVEGSPQDFGGPAVSVQGVTSGNLGCESSKRYDNLNIPVVSGGEIQIQAALIGEDPGDATVCVTLGYVLA